MHASIHWGGGLSYSHLRIFGKVKIKVRLLDPIHFSGRLGANNQALVIFLGLILGVSYLPFPG